MPIKLNFYIEKVIIWIMEVNFLSDQPCLERFRSNLFMIKQNLLINNKILKVFIKFLRLKSFIQKIHF